MSTLVPSDKQAAQMNTRRQRRILLQRVHLWATFLATPFLLGALLTGILYIFTPQIEYALYKKLDKVHVGSARIDLDWQVQAAIDAAPSGWRLFSVLPGYNADDSTRIVFVPLRAASAPRAPQAGTHDGHAEHQPAEPAFLRPSFGVPKNGLVAYVDPYSNQVLGFMPEAERFNVWARRLHSTYLTEGWRWAIEFAASWTIVMLLTGIFLWWPGSSSDFTALHARKGREKWRFMHAWCGIIFSVVSIAILTTGLTWSRNAGSQVKWLRDAAGQQSPRIPASFKSTNPQSPADNGTHVIGVNFKGSMTWEKAFTAVKANAPSVAVELRAPEKPDGFWRANHIDRGDPTKRFDMLLDAYSGKPLYYSGWNDQPWFGKATAIGIPFHRGEFGIWNQVLLAVFGFGLLFSFTTGWYIFLKRRREGFLGLPKLGANPLRIISPVGYIAGAACFALMPLLFISGFAVCLLEIFLNRPRPNASLQ